MVTPEVELCDYLPEALQHVVDPSRELPRLAKDLKATAGIEAAAQRIPTAHKLLVGDARFVELPTGSIQLVLTSPPYWTLKEYPRREGQLGWIADYEDFLAQLDEVWRRCYQALTPGGRLVCVVGDVCLSRRRNGGRHTVVPLHAAIQEHCRRMGFDNLAPIVWSKIANAAYEVDRGARGGFLGKPYEPNGVIKNDIEFILMERKPGGYRRPSTAARVLSILPERCFRQSFKQVWEDIAGASTRDHPAPFPLALAERLIRMFSFVGDTVYDPFTGTGTTQVAAANWGRNSVGVEVDPSFAAMATERLRKTRHDLLKDVSIETAEADHAGCPSLVHA